MKVFISWSGERSHSVALILRKWLKQVIQSVEPFVSSEDIEKGSTGLRRITEELGETNFGIVCLTPENYERPWINFEAGALSKQADRARVATYLFDINSTDVRAPLSMFQWTEAANRDENLKLVTAINRAIPTPLDSEVLKESFDNWWPKLQAQLAEIPKLPTSTKLAKSPRISGPEAQRTDRELLEEILKTVRESARKSEVPKLIIDEPLGGSIIIGDDGSIRVEKSTDTLLKRARKLNAEVRSKQIQRAVYELNRLPFVPSGDEEKDRIQRLLRAKIVIPQLDTRDLSDADRSLLKEIFGAEEAAEIEKAAAGGPVRIEK